MVNGFLLPMCCCTSVFLMINLRLYAMSVGVSEHFQEVEISVVFVRKCVDVFNGQLHKSLLTLLKERENAIPEEPSFVFVRLRPVESGSREGLSLLIPNFSGQLTSY